MSQVICLGEILIDRMADQPGHDKGSIQSWTDFPGGAPANVACRLQRLGISSAFLGCVGADEVGDRLLQILAESGVDARLIQRHLTAPTRVVYVTRDEGGDRQFAGFGDRLNAEFADTHLIFEPDHQLAFQSAQFFYLGSLMLAEEATRQTVDQYLDLAEQCDLQIWMDINWRPMFWANPARAKEVIAQRLSWVRWLKVADEEAGWLFDSDDPQQICDRYPNLQGVFVTAGSAGCRYVIGGVSGQVPGFAVNAVDTTGAGDGFVAGCIAGLIRTGGSQTGQDGQDLVCYANAVGALTTLQLGAIASHPTDAEVREFLQNSGG